MPLKHVLIGVIVLVTAIFLLMYIVYITTQYVKGTRFWDFKDSSKNHNDELQPNLEWDSFDSFHSPPANHIFQAQCVSVQPRTYDELQKSEERLVETSSTSSEQEHPKTCKLKFSLKYNTVSSTLAVHLLAAKNPPTLWAKGDMSYYVTIKIFPQSHRSFSSRAIKSGAAILEFNELFEFLVSEQNLLNQNLKFMLCFFDRFSHHDVIGELRVDLADIETRGLTLSREILLLKEINKVLKEAPSVGEIMLSLGYLRLTERLAVVAISAKNLPSLENGQRPDPYVEVTLQHSGTLLKHKKTSSRIKDHNPVFNECLTFHIPHGILHQSSLLICLKHDAGLSGRNVKLGQVSLGPEAAGIQFEHWNEMRVNNKPIARWHKLVADSK